MKISALWSIVHAWNANRKHKRCMVTVADAWDISTEGLVIDWVNACAHGTLRPIDEVRRSKPCR